MSDQPDPIMSDQPEPIMSDQPEPIMSDQTEPEKSADATAQYPSQPPAYQAEPPHGQYLPPGQYAPTDQKYPPTAQYPPQGQYPPSAHYNQSQASATVVTVQPVQADRRYAVVHQSAARDYLTFTIVGLVICFFCGGVVGMVLLVPALICSVMASNANSSGDYHTAKKLGKASLIWNIGVYILYTLATIAWVVAVIVITVQVSQPNIICGTDRNGPLTRQECLNLARG